MVVYSLTWCRPRSALKCVHMLLRSAIASSWAFLHQAYCVLGSATPRLPLIAAREEAAQIVVIEWLSSQPHAPIRVSTGGRRGRYERLLASLRVPE